MRLRPIRPPWCCAMCVCAIASPSPLPPPCSVLCQALERFEHAVSVTHVETCAFAAHGDMQARRRGVPADRDRTRSHSREKVKHAQQLVQQLLELAFVAAHQQTGCTVTIGARDGSGILQLRADPSASRLSVHGRGLDVAARRASARAGLVIRSCARRSAELRDSPRPVSSRRSRYSPSISAAKLSIAAAVRAGRARSVARAGPAGDARVQARRVAFGELRFKRRIALLQLRLGCAPRVHVLAVCARHRMQDPQCMHRNKHRRGRGCRLREHGCGHNAHPVPPRYESDSPRCRLTRPSSC